MHRNNSSSNTNNTHIHKQRVPEQEGSEVGQGKEGGERAKKERLAKGRQIGVQQCRQTDANCGDK